jgi:23S rRNA (guanine745-N1)-methyltransferase
LLADVVDLLRCPVCSATLDCAGGVLRCPAGHSFDVARQGYVNLVPGRGDTTEMVAARAAFLDSGHYRRFDDALSGEAAQVSREPSAPAVGAVLDLGSGTAHHLAAVLDALPDRLGLALDSSTAALRRAAHAHPRAAAIGADAWKPLPLRDGVAAIVLSVFAPRNAAEIARVLAPRGTLIAVTPTTRHLYELVGSLRLLSVPDDKEDRLDAQLGSHFNLAARRAIEHSMFLARDEAAQIVRMGPSAWHVDERSVAERLAAMPDPLTVTASMTLSRYVRGRP